jgi:hypothetical protein
VIVASETGLRHCEEQSDEAIQSFLSSGLLRFARNDERDLKSAQLFFSPDIIGPNNSQLSPLKRGLRGRRRKSKEHQMKRVKSDHDACASNEG